MMHCRWFFAAILFLLLLLFLRPAFLIAWQRNEASSLTFRSLLIRDPKIINAALDSQNSLRNLSCQSNWYLVHLYQKLGDQVHSEQALEDILRCSPDYISFIRAIYPQNLRLAKMAVEVYPEEAEALFWLVDLMTIDFPELAINLCWQGLQLEPNNEFAWVQMSQIFSTLDPETAFSIYDKLDIKQLGASNPLLLAEMQFVLASILANVQPDQAIELYRHGLQSKSYDGVRWYELGDLLSEVSDPTAIDAYIQSCRYGDPGNHGCYNAGLIAEKKGDIPAAIRYYRMSDWEGALNRATSLELSYTRTK